MFSKWELVEENRVMIERSFSIWDENYHERRVLVDVYRKKRFNGTYKYKYIKRY